MAVNPSIEMNEITSERTPDPDREVVEGPRLSDPIYRQLFFNENVYRDWLQTTFKPIFDQHEERGGMLTRQVLELFQNNSYGLPRHKLSSFLSKMDADSNGRVTYKEFFDAMIHRRLQDLKRRDRVMLSLVLAVVPTIKRDERKRQSRLSKIQVDEIDGSVKEVEETDKVPDEIPDSYLEAYNCRPPPIFMPIICLTEIIVFIVYALQINERGSPGNQLSWTTGYPHWSPLIYDPRYREEAWRFITYMFIHQGYHHIIFNVILQLLLGIPLEVVHKFWRVGPVFLAGVLAGSLASSCTDMYTSLVGASGGCYALIGGHYALVVMNWEELQHEWLDCGKNPFAFIFSGIMRLIVLTFLLLIDFGVALYRRYGLGLIEKTSYAAHVGGLLAGLLVGIPVLKNIDKKPWEAVIFWISLVIFIIFFLFGIFWNVFYTGFPSKS